MEAQAALEAAIAEQQREQEALQALGCAEDGGQPGETEHVPPAKALATAAA